VRYCFESLLNQHPTMAGKVTVSFVVSSEGRVLRSEVAESTVGVQALGDCVAGRVSTWVFPSAKGMTFAVKYPFVFKTSGH
jgi:TonB family protein